MAVEDERLLDPTLDQANKKEWPRSMRVGPLAIRLSENFWAEQDRSWFGRTSAACGSLASTAGRFCQCRPIGSFEPPGGGRRDQLTKKERTAMTQEHSEGQARRAAKRVGLMARKSPGARARSIFSANS